MINQLPMSTNSNFVLIKIGTDSRPAIDEDIDKVKKEIEKSLEDIKNNGVAYFVSHHAIDIQFLEMPLGVQVGVVKKDKTEK